ncbi:unnamed protein product [Urochloa humidicola]
MDDISSVLCHLPSAPTKPPQAVVLIDLKPSGSTFPLHSTCAGIHRVNCSEVGLPKSVSAPPRVQAPHLAAPLLQGTLYCHAAALGSNRTSASFASATASSRVHSQVNQSSHGS